MAVKYGNTVLATTGKQSDMVNLAYNTNWDLKNALVIDLPRSYEGKLAFGAVEAIKNGYISNTKYETGEKIFATPHVLIMANHPPYDLSEVSADRWQILQIVDKKLI